VRRVQARHAAPGLARPHGDPGRLEARSVAQAITSFERTESFSGLMRHAHDAPRDETPLTEEAARDHDAEPVEHGALPAGEEDEPRVADERIVLAEFPRGPRAGNFFHEIFEDIDFASATGEELLEVASQKFESFGYAREYAPAERDRLLGSAVRAVMDVLDAELLPCRFRLADVPRERRFSELEFRVPVGRSGARANFDVPRLARVFRAHPSDAVPARYAERLERLGFESLRGFLKGYIDLVFRHDGLWYVVDYKTNHLGDVASEYDAERMTREMADSHYYLQYHLYTLAVDRFLRRVEPGYDYETKFGGVLYLFVKGMQPAARTGIFFEKPPAARLAALGALLDGEDAA
jgi:exodeoxyribonuclease V beta subunit